MFKIISIFLLTISLNAGSVAQEVYVQEIKTEVTLLLTKVNTTFKEVTTNNNNCSKYKENADRYIEKSKATKYLILQERYLKISYRYLEQYEKCVNAEKIELKYTGFRKNPLKK